MPSAKKKNKGNSSKNSKAQRAATQAFHEVNAPRFRDLLLAARQEYAKKGRSYDAAEMQREAIQLGDELLPRFGGPDSDNSLIRAHVLMELSLSTSAILTDFAVSESEERTKQKQQMQEALDEALQIYENRLSAKTLTRFRKEECWFKDGEYHSPIPHTERLGPVDYVTCAHFATAFQEPSMKNVQSMKKALQFTADFRAKQRAIQLEGGPALQGELPTNAIDKLRDTLREHEAVLAGEKTTEEAMAALRLQDDDELEVRHCGTRSGKMKVPYKKLVKEVDKKGLRCCENPECDKMERQPRQFQTCSRCKWVAYCTKECQVDDWKRHKQECRTEATQKRVEYEEQNKDASSLKYGQSQQLLVIVQYLHHYAVTSKEMASTKTIDAARVNLMVKPKFEGLELGQLQLGMQEVTFTWNALWSMEAGDRQAMIKRFVREMDKNYSHCFPPKHKGGPDFGVVADWGRYAVSGDFAIVKYTPQGSIMLHDHGDGKVRAYLVVGITQSIESILAAANKPLPLYVNTAILPFKGLILCQGTIVPSFKTPSSFLEEKVNGFVRGTVELDVLKSLL